MVTLRVYQAILLTFLVFVSNGFAQNNLLSTSENIMSVQIKSTLLRTKPSFLGKKITSLKYGDKVSVVEEKDPWMQVTTIPSIKKGWVHLSALSEKNIILQSSDYEAKSGADQGEIVLAGKGFSKSEEEAYLKNNSNLLKPYKNVNRLEKKELSYGNLYNFAKKGKLNIQF